MPDPSANEVAIFSPSVNSDGSIFAVTSNVDDGRFPGCTRSYNCGVINRAYRWSVAGGYQSLGTFGATWSLSTSGISGDGNVISGNAYDTAASSSILIGTAFRWTPSDGLQALPSLTPATGSPSFAASNGISRDGSTIVGVSRGADNLVQAVFWRGLSVTALGYVPGTNPASAETEARAANADGSIIVGTNRLDRAWRWTSTSGMQDLNLIATNAGLNLNGFVLTDAVGVSDNGQFITGNSFNAAQGQFLGYVLQLAQITQSRLIVTIRLPGVTQTSIINQTFNTQVDALLNGTNVFTRTVTDPINGAGGVTALADARSALQVGSGLRRVVIGAPTLLWNVTTVLGTTNNTVDVPSGTTTSTATINTFGPATVITGDLGVCASGVVGSSAPTGCSLPGTPVTVDSGILNSNVYTQTNNTVTPTTTQTVNQLITAKWQISATAGNQFGTVHALVGPAAFERGDRLIGQLLGMGGGDNAASSGIARAAMPVRDESGLGGGESGLTMFGGYFGGRSSIDADASIPVARVKGDSDGFVLGLQQALGDTAHIGIAVDHGSSDYTVRDPLYPETLKLKHTQAALFAGWSDGGFSLSGAASYGFGTARTNLLTPTTPATGSRDINSWSLGVQAGYAVSLGKDASLTPHIGIRHTSAKLKRFTETGGPTPLLGLSQTVDRTRFYAGLEAKAGIDLGGVTLTPRVYGRIASDSGDASGTADLVFASAPTGPVMQALGPGVGKTVGELGGGLDAAVSDSISIWASYDGTFREHANSNSAKVGLTVRW
ncbi:autotransporter domain-containing protein [Sphingorhabdus lacus]|uniref:autotransporter domain-containing protein n=1 Tax=Sphingorhabdus lacus TaxID=392610 RepID=UPI00359387CA